MTWRRPSVTHVAMLAASVGLFLAAGHFAVKAVIDGHQKRQLEELADVALRRAEVAVSFGAATLDELAAKGTLNCDPGTLQSVRLQVYQRSTVKDIRLVNRDGSVICSAYSETLEFDSGWVDRADMSPSQDGRLLLFRVDQFGGLSGTCRPRTVDVLAGHPLIVLTTASASSIEFELRHSVSP